MNTSQNIANFTAFLTKNTPAIISKPINFVLNTVLGGTVRMIANVINLVQTVQQKLADISDKLTAIMGELKASIEKKISENFKVLKKKIKRLFMIFQPVEETENKKTFKLKTFIHDLYKKLTGDNDDD